MENFILCAVNEEILNGKLHFVCSNINLKFSFQQWVIAVFLYTLKISKNFFLMFSKGIERD